MSSHPDTKPVVRVVVQLAVVDGYRDLADWIFVPECEYLRQLLLYQEGTNDGTDQQISLVHRFEFAVIGEDGEALSPPRERRP